MMTKRYSEYWRMAIRKPPTRPKMRTWRFMMGLRRSITEAAGKWFRGVMPCPSTNATRFRAGPQRGRIPPFGGAAPPFEGALDKDPEGELESRV
jgi:hypothetical protein